MAVRSKSSATDAYELLLEAIENRTLPAGTRLREVELAERFEISRTPVREALKKLEAQGLVSHEPHYGTRVATLDYGQISDLYHMREVLEGTAAYLAALHATSIEIELLRELITLDREGKDDPEGHVRRNRQFHLQLRLAAHNRFLNPMLENLRLSLALVRSADSWANYRNENSIDEHEAVVERIEARDPQGAENVTRFHIRNTFKGRIRLLMPLVE